MQLLLHKLSTDPICNKYDCLFQMDEAFLDVTALAEVLKAAGISPKSSKEIAEKLFEKRVTIEMLFRKVTDEHLREFEIVLGQRIKLMELLEEYRKTGNVPQCIKHLIRKLSTIIFHFI